MSARETLSTAEIAAAIPAGGADLMTIAKALSRRAGWVRRGLRTMAARGTIEVRPHAGPLPLYLPVDGITEGPVDVPLDPRARATGSPEFVDNRNARSEQPLRIVKCDGTETGPSLKDRNRDEQLIRDAASAFRAAAVTAAAKLVTSWHGEVLTKPERRIISRQALEIEITALRDVADDLEANLPKIKQPLPANTAV